jgi:proteasome lid subunit RPN8/RPN11
MSEGRLRIRRSDLDRIIDHLRGVYPLEGCGLLVGTRQTDFDVRGAWPVTNEETEVPERRYRIDPGTFARLDAKARDKGLEIIGVFHSHPDEAPMPSTTDTQLAWPELAYLIVGLTGDEAGPGEATSRAHWKAGNDDAMTEIPLDIV